MTPVSRILELLDWILFWYINLMISQDFCYFPYFPKFLSEASLSARLADDDIFKDAVGCMNNAPNDAEVSRKELGLVSGRISTAM